MNTTNVQSIRFKNFIVLILISSVLFSSAFAWSTKNHNQITRAAVETLSREEVELLGAAEADSMIIHYSLNPDYHRAAVRAKNEEKEDFYHDYIDFPLLQSLKKWHKNDDKASEICFYITTKTLYHAIDNLKKGNKLEAAKYLGSLCHFLEDNACPVHVLSDQTIHELLPSSDYPKRMNKHRAVDRAEFKIDIDGYDPILLGDNIVEVSEAIYFRFKDNRVNSRAQTVPLLQAIYANKKRDINKYANNAAKPAAELLADILHTVCVLAAEK